MGVHRVTVNMSMHSSVVQNVWHIETDEPLTDTELQTFVTGLITPMRAEVSADLTFNDLEHRRVDVGDTTGAIFVPTGWPLAGQQVGAAMPSFVTALIKGTTLSGGKPNRFRKFIPGLREADIDQSQLNAQGLTNMGDIVSAWQAFLDGQTDPQIVTVRYGDPLQAEDPRVVQAWNTVQNVSLAPFVRTLSSRRLGRGI